MIPSCLMATLFFIFSSTISTCFRFDVIFMAEKGIFTYFFVQRSYYTVTIKPLPKEKWEYIYVKAFRICYAYHII